MSQRARIRAIAKARLQAMGVPHVNKVMGKGLSHTKMWRRVTNGDLARDGYRAQMGSPGKRRFRVA